MKKGGILNSLSLFFIFLVSSFSVQLFYVFLSFLFMISYGGGKFGSFLFFSGALWYYLIIIVVSIILKQHSWKIKSAFFISGLPFLILFIFNMFIGFGHNSHLQIEDKTRELTFQELPNNVQLFFEEWEGKSITRNKVVTSGHHPLGHQHCYYSNGFRKLMVEGKVHSFYVSNKKFVLPMFVKNAFYMDGDIFYYSSDFLNLFSVENASYHSIDLNEYYHPKGANIPHEFNQKIFDNNREALN